MSNDAAAETINNNWADARCIDCGYALRGLIESPCPECGLAFDRANPATFNSGRHCGRIARWLLGRTRWLAGLNAVVVAGVVAAQAIFFLPDYATLFILMLAWFGLAGPYMFWSIVRRMVVRVYAQPARFLRPDQQARRRISRNVLIGVVIIISQVPSLVPFWISSPWLDRYANHLYTEVPMLFPSPSMDRWCGVYYVHGCSLEPNGVWMYVGGRYMVYRPSGEFGTAGSYSLRQFSGDWYIIGPGYFFFWRLY